MCTPLTLSIVNLVLLLLGANLDQLFVCLGSLLEVLHVIVAVAQERKGSSGSGEVLELKLED